ncbi:MAG: phosphopantothenoylcysteine decarboxylase [Calditrichaceae bacterium]|nr:phosphopantothenoylcysteine decarboxylase [Calditrichaceae bacterium]
MKLLIGVTSSIAAYRIPNLVSMLKKENYDIKTIVTEHAKAFVAPQALAVMSQNPCFSDSDEWTHEQHVLHIELAKWCDIYLLAPLSANTLAKIANGLCDNLLTSTVRALGGKPLIIAPAMNTAMWENPITQMHIDQCRQIYNLQVINPISKKLADGDVGIGGLADDETIISELRNLII